ncbi:MAG: NrfD/PsrC family molybdoenzyme membrane anchor subunit [Actinoallomurus sp.]
MSEAKVTREGVSATAPGREARNWSHNGSAETPGREPNDHPGASYYGAPVIKRPVWEELNIAGYLFTGGLAGASSLLAAGADLTRRRTLARRARLGASAAIGVSLVALIHDLGRPARFLNMLRVFKPTSPMSVGAWLLAAHGGLSGASAASGVTGILPSLGRAAGAGAALTGPILATYTGVLMADTAVPAWHESYRHMPFLFAGSSLASAGAVGMAIAPRDEARPARRMALLGAGLELASAAALERGKGMREEPELISEPYRTGRAGAFFKYGRGLTAAGAAGTLLAGRSRTAAVLSAVALTGGAVCTRFGVLYAGFASAEDPKYTVIPQRARAGTPTGA